MEGRNIPLIIMLLAGSAVCIACIVYRFPLLHTLIAVFLTLVAFYLIGLIVRKIIMKINRDAEERAALYKREQAEAGEENMDDIADTSSAEEAEEEQQEDGFSVD